MNLRFAVKIVEILAKSRSRPITILQLSKNAQLSYNAAYRTIHELSKEGVISLIQVGSASIAQLTESKKAKGFAALAEAYSKDEKIK